MAESAAVQRAEVYYAGRVQGVGFRVTTRQIAQQFGVVGYVRNLSDGRVHLVAEGPADRLTATLTELASRMEHCIETTEQTLSSGTGEFTLFTIR